MEWRTIDSAPKDGTIVWVGHDGRGGVSPSLCPGYFVHGAWRNWFKGPDYTMVVQAKGRVSTGESVEIVWFEPTHWMPLPAPPSADPGIPVYRMKDATEQLRNEIPSNPIPGYRHDVLGKDGE